MTTITNHRRFISLYLLGVILAIAAVLILPADVLAAGAKGSGSVKKAGDNAADLLSGLVGPLLIVGIGVVGVVAFVTRNVGLLIGAVACGLVAGLFVFAPDSAEDAFNGVYKAVF
jgi:hypothetical protein